MPERWIDRTTGFFAGSREERRAEAAIAVVDGLLLMRQLSGPEAAGRAAKVMGVA